MVLIDLNRVLADLHMKWGGPDSPWPGRPPHCLLCIVVCFPWQCTSSVHSTGYRGAPVQGTVDHRGPITHPVNRDLNVIAESYMLFINLCQNQLWINYLKQIQYNTCSNKTKFTKAIKLTRMLKFYQKYDFFYPVMNFLIWSKEGIWSGSVPGGWWRVWTQLEVQLDVPTSCSFWTDFIEGWMSGWGWTGVSLRIQCRGRRPLASWLKEHIGRI